MVTGESTPTAARKRRPLRATRLSANAVGIVLALVSITSSKPRPARADENEKAPAPIEIVVRGSTAGGYAAKSSTDTYGREPIDAAAMIADLPGVHVRRLGSESAFASVSVRGSASTQVGVLLAGIPLTSAADPAFDVGSLPLFPGASFRVYRGFAPASLGTTGYLGGVLSIEAPSPTAGERTEWWAGAGSFGSLKLRVGDTRKIGKLSLGTGLFASRSDGDFSYEITEPLTGKLTTRTRRNAGHVIVGGLERISLERSWGSVGALILADARKLGIPGPALLSTRFATTESARLVAALNTTVRVGSSSALGLVGWARRQSATLDDPASELGVALGANRQIRSATDAIGLSANFRSQPFAKLNTGLVLDARLERFLPDSDPATRQSPEASRLFAGVGVELRYRPIEDLTLSASARLDARRDNEENNASDGGARGLGPNGHIGLSYRLHPALVVSAHAGALFRPPSFPELFGNSTTLLGNPALDPERAYSADLGLHGDLTDGHSALGYELVAFVTAAEELIAFAPYGRTTFRADNIDRALLAGAEISAAFASRGLRHQLSYTWLFTRNQSNSPLEQGRPLPSRPQHDLAYDVSYRFGPVRVRYGLDAIAGTTVDARGTILLPARVLHSTGLSLDLPFEPDLRAAIDVNNLFDLRTLHVDSPLKGSASVPISDFLGFPLPGRSVWITLRYQHRAGD